MSVSYIMDQSIFRVKPAKSKRKHSKQGLTARGGNKKPTDSVTSRLADGRVRKCMQYQPAPHRLVTTVSGVRITLCDERTYSDELKKRIEVEKENQIDKPEPNIFLARKTCTRLESKEESIKVDKFGFQKKQGSNGRRVQKHSSKITFK